MQLFAVKYLFISHKLYSSLAFKSTAAFQIYDEDEPVTEFRQLKHWLNIQQEFSAEQLYLLIYRRGYVLLNGTI